ncbi:MULTISPECIES: host-nuclease inhibitor Gam family protein [Lactobacillaceae]|uniref:host-nuclease inhibitor Gam family protein n=1 Tax=Lactobacillaceae TaxID=33958 RepID=UPI0014571C58|nr:host-nuclease inhibitor Gam family protein [Lactobacillus sp. HBUAS51381]NLR08696.1 hypothetical protein [Lactobacillus sp. HBUAS51381]
MDALEKMDLEDARNEADKPKFEITDTGSATWVMRKYQALVANDEDSKRDAEEQIKDIKKKIKVVEKWLDNKLQANAENRAFFEEKLADYLMKLRIDDPKARIDTPFGTVSTQKSRKGVLWSDEAVVKSLEKQGLSDLIRIKKEPDKKEIAKHFHFVGNRYVNEDGLVLEGALPKEVTESLKIKLAEDS